MWANLSSLIILPLVLAVTLANTNEAAATLDEYLSELDGKQADLNREFDLLIKKFYWSQQELAHGELMKADQLGAYQLKAISNLFTEIEYTKFAVRSKTIQEAKELLRKEYNKQILESNLVLDADLTAVLLSRFELRSLVDGFQSTATKWNELYLQITRSEKSGPIQSLVREIFKQRSYFGEIAQEVSEKLVDLIETYCQKNGLEAHQVGAIIIIALDGLIDRAMGCQECAELFEPNEEVFDVYPMFSEWSQVYLLARKSIDASLLESVNNSKSETLDHLPEISHEEIDAVDEMDINDYQEAYMTGSQ